MIKKVLLFALIMLPVLSFAQEGRIAYVDYNEIVPFMPEYKQMDDSLRKEAQAYEIEMKSLSDEFSKKVEDFVANQETLPESVKTRRQQEIENIRTNAENFQQQYQLKQDEIQQKMLIPIQARLQKAVDEVGAENNFLYIIDNTTLRFISPNAANATPLIKSKLGI